MTDETTTGRPSPLEARLAEAEDQCRFERAKRVELAALVAGFIQRVVPLINDAGLSLDPRELERVVKPSPVVTMRIATETMSVVVADTARVIFEQGGGTTLQIEPYAYFYPSADLAARDVLHWLAGSDASKWEGHDPDDMYEPTSAEIRDGCYLVTQIDRTNPQLEVIANDLAQTNWRNAAEFAAAIRRGTP
jgi:hypothetical protein